MQCRGGPAAARPPPDHARRRRDTGTTYPRSAGIGRVSPHRLRHTLATQAINRGMSLEAIAALLGHHVGDRCQGSVDNRSHEAFSWRRASSPSKMRCRGKPCCLTAGWEHRRKVEQPTVKMALHHRAGPSETHVPGPRPGMTVVVIHQFSLKDGLGRNGCSLTWANLL